MFVLLFGLALFLLPTRPAQQRALYNQYFCTPTHRHSSNQKPAAFSALVQNLNPPVLSCLSSFLLSFQLSTMGRRLESPPPPLLRQPRGTLRTRQTRGDRTMQRCQAQEPPQKQKRNRAKSNCQDRAAKPAPPAYTNLNFFNKTQLHKGSPASEINRKCDQPATERWMPSTMCSFCVPLQHFLAPSLGLNKHTRLPASLSTVLLCGKEDRPAACTRTAHHLLRHRQ